MHKPGLSVSLPILPKETESGRFLFAPVSGFSLRGISLGEAPSAKKKQFSNGESNPRTDVGKTPETVIPDFFKDVSRYGSLSVVGMAKNVGKTVCLRALIEYGRVSGQAPCWAVTSIGMDGESTDTLYKTAKPELDFYPGMLIQTSEQHYARRRLSAEILQVSRETTACGRIVTARVITPGKLILSGYAHTQGLRRFISQVRAFGARTAIIDGALSRMSLASPFVSEAVILCTGAALSKNLQELVRKTRFQYALMNLPVFRKEAGGQDLAEALGRIRSGVFGISPEGEVEDLQIPSLLQVDKYWEKIEPYCRQDCFLYISGLLNDSFLQSLVSRKERPEVVVSDFSKLFLSPQVFSAYSRAGSRLWVLQQPEVIGICVNPHSPEGYDMDSLRLRESLSEALGREVFDILA